MPHILKIQITEAQSITNTLSSHCIIMRPQIISNPRRQGPPLTHVWPRYQLVEGSSHPPYFSNSSYATLGDTPDGIRLASVEVDNVAVKVVFELIQLFLYYCRPEPPNKLSERKQLNNRSITHAIRTYSLHRVQRIVDVSDLLDVEWVVPRLH